MEDEKEIIGKERGWNKPHFQAWDALYDTTWMDNGDTTGLSLLVC
jgi:hypothetical protein